MFPIKTIQLSDEGSWTNVVVSIVLSTSGTMDDEEGDFNVPI